MPSPIIHTTAGYVLYRLSRKADNQQSKRKRYKNLPPLLLFSIGMSLLPDLDSIPGLIVGNLSLYHNNAFHSLSVGVLVALVGGLIARYALRLNYWLGFLIGLVGYEVHIILDYFTIGRGVMLFWPLTQERYESPIKLFYGLRWSEGLLSYKHLWTLASETLVVAVVFLLDRVSIRKSSQAIQDPNESG